MNQEKITHNQMFGNVPKTYVNAGSGAQDWSSSPKIVECVLESVLTALTCSNSTGASKLNGATLPAGTVIEDVTAVTVTSGLIKGYNKAGV